MLQFCLTSSQDAAGDIMYIVTGDEKALVVDTTLGAGNIKKLVEFLTDLPYEVVLTHGHVDHIGGMFGFDQVYLNEKDWNIVEDNRNFKFKVNAYFGGIHDASISKIITEADFETTTIVKLNPLNAGDTFDLGHYTVEVLEAMGHTQGSVALLFKEDRLLLTGDAVNTHTYMFFDYSTTLETYYKVLKKLNAHANEWDALLVSHSTYIPYDKSMIDDCIEICEEIVETGVSKGQVVATQITQQYGYTEVFLAKEIDPHTDKRIDGKVGNIFYDTSAIYDAEPQ